MEEAKRLWHGDGDMSTQYLRPLFTGFATFAFVVAGILAPVYISFAASNLPVQDTRAFSGIVTNVHEHQLEMSGVDARGHFVRPKFDITEMTTVENGILLLDADFEVRTADLNEIRRGSTVRVWYTAGGDAIIIRNLAPKGQGNFYGPVDCPTCAGAEG